MENIHDTKAETYRRIRRVINSAAVSICPLSVIINKVTDTEAPAKAKITLTNRISCPSLNKKALYETDNAAWKASKIPAYIEVHDKNFYPQFLYQAPVIRVFNSGGIRDGRLLFNQT